ncbi:MAG: hypothetical protein ACLGH1_02590 [Gammaproteobacteria bacterium]|nr:hypothetical protein [Rhodocyclaceae bacterium]
MPSSPAAPACPLRRVILFAGHMVDAPGRAQPRFPPDRVPEAARRIAAALAELEAGPADLGLTQGAAGGDLLFAEAALARAMPVEFLQPFAEAEFIERSVRPVSDGEDWVARYRAVAERLATPPRVMPPGPPDANPFERCNRWLLDTALAHGGEQVWLLCLWDGQGGDGAGGTAHMVGEVRRHHGHVIHIDCRRLWQGASP